MTPSTFSAAAQAVEDSSAEKQLRLLIVTRRFWPHSSLTELAIADLACLLKQRGHDVVVVSSLGEKEWTPRILYRQVPVYRIARQATGPWSAYRYQRAYHRFFSEQKKFDGIIVSGLGDEALATTRIFGGKIPIVLRIDNSMEGVDDQLHRRHVEICQEATHVVSNCVTLAKRISQVAEMPTVTVIRDGVPICERPRTLASQSNARLALAQAHPILHSDPAQPLVVGGIRMLGDNGTMDLVDAWKSVLASVPGAKLWLLGDGTMGSQIWQRIVNLNLVHAVVLPGYFDDLEDLFLAADLYVHPSQTEACCECLPRAMATGMAPVVTDTRWARTIIRPDGNGLLVPRQNSSAMAEAIIHAINNSELRNRLGEQAKTTVEKEFGTDLQIDKYLALFHSHADPATKSTDSPVNNRQ